jgi:hypothetical protein
MQLNSKLNATITVEQVSSATFHKRFHKRRFLRQDHVNFKI